MNRCSIKYATIILSPPALSAPAIPMKIVTSSASIFCQTRCAVPSERPWNEMCSIFSRSSSALTSGSTVNGWIGTCKKRERCFMLRNFTLSGDIPEGREIDLRREMDALQLRLRDGVILFCPKADVGRKLGDALLNLRITHFALVGAGRARRVIYQPVELWIV